MKFGKTLREQTLKEWRFYAVDYKALKNTLKVGNDKTTVDEEEFFCRLEESKMKVSKFYDEKEAWALKYMKTLEERVEALRETAMNPPTPPEFDSPSSGFSSSSNSSVSFGEENEGGKVNIEMVSTNSPTCAVDFAFQKGLDTLEDTGNWLKEEYRRMGKSEHFQNFIYAKKSLTTFARELDLLLEFLSLNKTGFSKILKKFDKRTGSMIREDTMAELLETHAFLDGEVFSKLKHQVADLIDEVDSLKPRLPEGWENRKVYTIGCFDLFHRGHQNVLMSLREFGYFIVAGIHDDESYFKLKNKYTIDNLETRMANVKPFVDQLYVIPSTDPLLYIKSMVSAQDIEAGTCCYARGDDMLVSSPGHLETPCFCLILDADNSSFIF